MKKALVIGRGVTGASVSFSTQEFIELRIRASVMKSTLTNQLPDVRKEKEEELYQLRLKRSQIVDLLDLISFVNKLSTAGAELDSKTLHGSLFCEEIPIEEESPIFED